LPARLARRPDVRAIRWAAGLGLLAAAVDLPSHLGSGDQLKAATVVVFAIVGVSLVILTGWAGQVSLGQMGFVAVGAAVGAWTTQTHGQDLAVGLLAAAGAGSVAALVVGLPALRLRGLSLAVVTLAFNVATASYLLAPDDAGWIPDTRVTRGPVLGVDLTSERRMYWLCLAVLVAVLWAAHAVRTSRPGRAMVAQRDNELAAEARGTSTARTRLTAFALSGAIAATAGCLLVHLLQSYPDQLLTPDRSISTFGATVVGGIGSPAGAVLGALLFVGSGWFLGDTARVLSTAVGLLLVLVLVPSGITGALSALRDRVLRLVLGPPAQHRRPVPDGADDDRPAATVPGTIPARPGSGGGTVVPALRVRGLQVRIGSTVIVDDVSFDLAPGQTLALLGTNGAGKSTVLNAISGLLPTSAGSVEHDGVAITGRRAHRIAARGIVQAPGGRGVFPSLTVAEHLTLAGWTRPRRDAGVRERTDSALEAFPALRARWHEHAADLSGGEQQMLVLAMASVAAPTVLLIDELALGLAPIVVRQLVAFLDRMRAAGTSIVVVEQSPAAALTLTDTAIFLEQGRVVLAGSVTDVLDRPDVARSVYLAAAAGPADASGPSDDRPGPPRPVGLRPASRPPALAAHGVSVSYGGVHAVTDVDLDVAGGEIVGLIGPNGAGKSTLLDVLSGLVPHAAGHVRLGDRDVTATPFHRRAALGLGRSFQDARLFPSLTVEEVLAIACDRSMAAPGVTDAILRTPVQRQGEAAVRHRVGELLALLTLGDLRAVRTGELSTGQRRIVDLAALLADRPQIVLLDEPSSGLAQPEVEALGRLLRRLHRELDLTMVVVEHDIPLISSMASRLVMLDQGRIIADGPPTTVLRDDRVIASYLGVVS
ncbi:MAG TPA: ATP-binding cassette domain-containing protein, partial [Iamia sp.]|nr:ATP-binding cassette domain-containing protein [Iamia sp.]